MKTDSPTYLLMYMLMGFVVSSDSRKRSWAVTRDDICSVMGPCKKMILSCFEMGDQLPVPYNTIRTKSKLAIDGNIGDGTLHSRVRTRGLYGKVKSGRSDWSL